ncbi:MAG: hypothetical protein R3300_07600 [Candidatus Promineifilaceae bacterium]|nr:hypothetical protein [Candidatus Promineifilaceae bacterium]
MGDGGKNQVDPEKEAHNGRLERSGRALFRIMIGGLGLVPDDAVP